MKNTTRAGWIAAFGAMAGVGIGAFLVSQLNVARYGGTLENERLSAMLAQSRLLVDAVETATPETFPAVRQWGLRSENQGYRGAMLDSNGKAVVQANSHPALALADSGFMSRVPELLNGRLASFRGTLASAPNVSFVAQRVQGGGLLVIEKTETANPAFWTTLGAITLAVASLIWGALLFAMARLFQAPDSLVPDSLAEERAYVDALPPLGEEFEGALSTVREQAIRRVELQALEAQQLLALSQAEAQAEVALYSKMQARETDEPTP